jgi:hypothetical protein
VQNAKNEDKLKQALDKHQEIIDDTGAAASLPYGQKDEFQRIEKPSLIGTIFGFIKVKIFGLSDPAYEKYILMKEVENEIKTLSIPVYNFRTNQISKNFGKLLYELYKFLYPLREIIDFFESKSKEQGAKDFFVFHHLTDIQKEEFNKLTGEGLKEVMSSQGLQNASKLINDSFQKLQAGITKEQKKEMNYHFSIIHSIAELIKFDLYPLIKRFSATFEEGNIDIPPAFKDVDGNVIVEDLKNLCFAIYAIDPSSDLKGAFTIYGKYKGSQIISDEDLKKFQTLIRKLINDQYLTLVIRTVEENPFFRPVHNFVELNIYSEFLRHLTDDIKTNRDKYLKDIQEEKVSKILIKLFNSDDFETLKNYTKASKENLYKKGARSFNYTEPLNYLKKFIMEIYNRYIRDAINKLLVEGDFVQKEFNRECSAAFIDCNSLMDDIRRFDEEYMSDEQMGGRIQKILPAIMRDQKMLVMLNKEIDEIDDEARKIIELGIGAFAAVLSVCKTVVTEYKNNGNDILTNIKGINGSENKDYIEKIVRAYNETQAIYALLKFMVGDK